MASKKKGEDRTPSADEIIEALSLEMGVTPEEGGEDAPDAEEKPDAASAEEASEQDAEESTDDAAAEGGEASEGEDAPQAEEKPADAKPAEKKADKKADKKVDKKADKKPEPKAEPKAAEKKADAKADAGGEEPPRGPVPPEVGIQGIFNIGPASNAPDPGLMSLSAEEEENDNDLDRVGGSNRLLIGVILLLVIGGGIGIVAAGGYTEDIIAVFKGEYRDKKDAEKRRIEEEFRKEQLAKLEKYGNLNITGTPYALFKIQLDGASEPKPLFGNIPNTNSYRPLRLPVTMQGLKIKQPINILIEAPGYRTKPLNLTENMWTGEIMGDYQYQTSLYLDYESSQASAELQDRMVEFDEEKDGAPVPAGTIFVDSSPQGAKIMIQKRLVVDKDGNPVLTPATITTIPVDPAKQDGKPEEPKPLVINTPPDNGYRVDVFFEDSSKPQYLDVVQRGLWTCEPKSEDDLKKLPKEPRAALKCNYTARVMADFNAIQAEINRQKAIEEELKKQAEEKQRIEEDAKKASSGM